MSKKKLKVAYICQFDEYEGDFILKLLRILHTSGIEFVRPRDCDLLILGPFPQRWFGLKLRYKVASKLALLGRRHPPIMLYHTSENTRWNAVPADFSISLDLGVAASNHCRFPLWMTMFDWTHEGVPNNSVERFGPAVDIDQLMRPLGDQKDRKAKAILMSSHLKEPRLTLLKAVESVMPVDCYGAAFSPNESNGYNRKFFKYDVCRDKQFGLCPENSMSPGYYTEKIPDAFACGCIPIAWCDSNVSHDFNPQAIINMAQYASIGYAEGLRQAIQPSSLQALREQPLLLSRPTLDGIKDFIRKMLADITS